MTAAQALIRNRKRQIGCGITLAIAMGLPQALPAHAAISCEEGKRYYDLARKSGSEQDFAKASHWLVKSTQACASYEAYHLLGTAYQKQRRLEESLAAYEKAVELAPEADKAAISVARYGQVLALNGQRYEALTMLERAIEMHSRPPSWLRKNAQELDRSLASKPVSGESIKRSLASQEFGLLSTSRFTRSEKAAENAGKTKVGIPINFEFNSTQMDNLTSANMEQLGQALTDDAYAGRTFTLVGHTDVRGDWGYNLKLSKRRAEAARTALIAAFPELDGRLSVRGAGEENPKYPGEALSDEDHRLNRRLEVLVD